jgi:hypothetical protein
MLRHKCCELAPPDSGSLFGALHKEALTWGRKKLPMDRIADRFPLVKVFFNVHQNVS